MSTEESKEPVFKFLKFSDIMNAPPESAESAYRRGYRDGWVRAIDSLHELMFDERMSRVDAYNRAWDFWKGELLKWEQRHAAGFELPPEVPGGK